MRRNKQLTGFSFSFPGIFWVQWNNTFYAILKFSFCLEFQLFIAWGKGQSPSFGILHRPYFQGHNWAGKEQRPYVIWKTFKLSWGHSFHRLNFKEKIISLKLEVLDDFKNLVRLDWKQPLIFRTLNFNPLHCILCWKWMSYNLYQVSANLIIKHAYKSNLPVLASCLLAGKFNTIGHCFASSCSCSIVIKPTAFINHVWEPDAFDVTRILNSKSSKAMYPVLKAQAGTVVTLSCLEVLIVLGLQWTDNLITCCRYVASSKCV